MHRVLLGLATVLAAWGGGRIDVRDSEIRSEWANGANRVAVPVHSRAEGAVAATLKLEWIDTEGHVAGVARRAIAIPPGDSRPVVVLPVAAMKGNGQVWLRLRYTLSPAGLAERNGIVAYTEIAPQAFRLQALHHGTAVPGTDYLVRVEARHPGNRQVVPAAITASIRLSGDTRVAPTGVQRDSESIRRGERTGRCT
jgi:hypothetical protein